VREKAPLAPIETRNATPSSRDKILDVAEALFSQRGYAGVGLRQVADAAGLGKSSLFHHFRSKAALYLAVLARVMSRIDATVSSALNSSGSHVERLDRVVEAFVDAMVEHPTTPRLLLRGLFEDDDLPDDAQPEAQVFESRLASLVTRLEQLIEEGVVAGAFRTASPAHTLQTLIGAVVYHFASGEFGEGLLGGPLFTAEAVRRRKQEIVTFMHHGLMAGAPIGGEDS
jgi:AcrR family transcriptional regulator